MHYNYLTKERFSTIVWEFTRVNLRAEMKTKSTIRIGTYSKKETQNLEKFHRSYFNHPDAKTWAATKSLAQPSFLKQVKSSGGCHSGEIINSALSSK